MPVDTGMILNKAGMLQFQIQTNINLITEAKIFAINLILKLDGPTSRIQDFEVTGPGDLKQTSASLRFVSPPNRTLTSSGNSVIFFRSSCSCRFRSPALGLQLSKWDVIRQSF